MLSFEQYQEIGRKNREYKKQLDIHLSDVRKQELKKMGVELTDNSDNDDFYGDCDSVYAMDDVSATILYLFIMIVAAIFNERWVVWSFATVVWLCHIFRHSIIKWRVK